MNDAIPTSALARRSFLTRLGIALAGTVIPWRAARATDDNRWKLTTRDMWNVGACFEEYSIDNNAYPVLAEGLSSLATYRALLEPVYIRTLPLADAWGPLSSIGRMRRTS